MKKKFQQAETIKKSLNKKNSLKFVVRSVSIKGTAKRSSSESPECFSNVRLRFADHGLECCFLCFNQDYFTCIWSGQFCNGGRNKQKNNKVAMATRLTNKNKGAMVTRGSMATKPVI